MHHPSSFYMGHSLDGFQSLSHGSCEESSYFLQATWAVDSHCTGKMVGSPWQLDGQLVLLHFIDVFVLGVEEHCLTSHVLRIRNS
ncbi:hypothetical protein MRB53_012152 [Persea americana]|uniref:Uncharacterized protein n=1 Tax=Persea americana TaxID=3435 RepID=A0ACC2LWU4_PERAE|nr:hypothetical protein MRB53_012152 [Persea americana]